MKPTDLMLNDWVLWNNRYVQIVRTCAYAYYNGHREVYLAHCNDDNFIEWHDMSTISPIPLTPQKFLRKMVGKKLNIGTSIKIIRLLFNVAYQNCEEKLMG